MRDSKPLSAEAERMWCVVTFSQFVVKASVLSQEIGWEVSLRNDLFYVRSDLKPWLNHCC